MHIQPVVPNLIALWRLWPASWLEFSILMALWLPFGECSRRAKPAPGGSLLQDFAARAATTSMQGGPAVSQP